MTQKKTIREISVLWKEDKKQYVKQSTFAAYVLILENHIYPTFGEMYELEERKVQEFTLQKINNGLSKKSIKDKTRHRSYSKIYWKRRSSKFKL